MATGRGNKNTVARIGGLTLHAYGDSKAIARRARRGFDQRFIDKALEIDPELRGEALEKKVQILRKLHFTRLAARSARKRSSTKKRASI